MSALIEELIGLVDASALVRDQIAAILLVESKRQQELAVLADVDPQKYKLRVFTERANPWEEFQDANDPHGQQDGDRDTSPIINVSLTGGDYDKSGSNSIERQRTTGTFQIDCYGCGVSTAGPTGGHDPGDARAMLESQQAYTLVRKILMSGHYAYLGLERGIVGDRWSRGFKVMQPAIDGRAIQRVAVTQLDFQVSFNEFSPQIQGAVLELVSVAVRRKETGELYLTADYAV